MRKLVTQLVDDLDGSDADETVVFALDGRSYEIDLSQDHARSLRKALGEYTARARRSGESRGRTTSNSTSPSVPRDPAQTRAIRRWALENGHDVSDRGRVPRPVLTAYEAAHDLRG